MGRTDALNQELAQRLRYAVDLTRSTHTYIANHLGVTRQSVSKWLKTGKVSGDNLEGMGKLLGFEAGWLMTGHGPMRTNDRSVDEVIRTLDPGAKILLDWYAQCDEARQGDLVEIAGVLADRARLPGRRRVVVQAGDASSSAQKTRQKKKRRV